MKSLKVILIAILASTALLAQKQHQAEKFPELLMTSIPGAPVLAEPMLVKGSDGNPLIGEGYGIAAPALYDWNGDGLRDLLIGEFGSGMEFGRYFGNFVRIHLNTGTDDDPIFDNDFVYARPPYEMSGDGTPYSVDQFCCMGFTPVFVDINIDGKQDMVSGQYFGEVIFFQGTERGFASGFPVREPGNPRERSEDYKVHQAYWLYSSVSFGDLTGDGKLDMVVGGEAIRMSQNLGFEYPSFDQRKLLRSINETPLQVYEYTEQDLVKKHGISVGGDYKLSPVVIDWDNDGTLDLLVTNSYVHRGLSVIDFFKGVRKNGEYRFYPPIPLFRAQDRKAFPGVSPIISVVDWNRDGVNDLMIGVSVITTNGEFNSSLSWAWEKEMGFLGFGKDPGILQGKKRETNMKAVLRNVTLPVNVSGEEFLTMRHQGYVYVMLGLAVEEKIN